MVAPSHQRTPVPSADDGPESTTRTAPGKSGAARARRRAEGRTAALFTLPAVVLLTTFILVPVALGFILAFSNARMASPEPPSFTGTQNFSRLLGVSVLEQEAERDTAGDIVVEDGEPVFPPVRDFTRNGSGYPEHEGKSILFTVDGDGERTVVLAGDPTFWKSLGNTFLFALVVVPVQAMLGLGLALLVNQPLRGIRFFRTAFFLPVVTSMVVVSILWRFMYQPNGLVNGVLGTFTLGAWDAVDWLGNPGTALPSIMVMSVWQGVGFHMIIWLAGLQMIPGQLYEAAAIDGAGAWRRFVHVTLPGLRSTLVFVLVTITIMALGLFVQIDVMTGGGPLDSTTTVIFHAVRRGFREQDIGYASAISLVFFVLVLTVSLIQRWLTRERD